MNTSSGEVRRSSSWIGFLVILALLISGYFLVAGLMDGMSVAYVVLGGLVFLLVAGMGGLFVLVVQWMGEAREARRDRREQERFRDNTKENLAILQMTARAQGTQNVMLLRQAREMQRSLPAPADVARDAMIEFDPALFDEMSVEE